METTTVPNLILTRSCSPVSMEDLRADKYKKLIASMEKAMIKHKGVGFAANQYGKNLALFIIDKKLAEINNVSSVFANPEITEYGRENDTLEEGCLSIPGFWHPIKRSKKIMFKALDGKGNKIKFRARGMLARVLQHETDHLNGITIKDHKTEK